MNKRDVRMLACSITCRLAGYGLLVVAFAASRQEEPLALLPNSDNLNVCAFVGLGLIVGQGLLLDAIASCLVNQLHPDRPAKADRAA